MLFFVGNYIRVDTNFLFFYLSWYCFLHISTEGIPKELRRNTEGNRALVAKNGFIQLMDQMDQQTSCFLNPLACVYTYIYIEKELVYWSYQLRGQLLSILDKNGRFDRKIILFVKNIWKYEKNVVLLLAKYPFLRTY